MVGHTYDAGLHHLHIRSRDLTRRVKVQAGESARRLQRLGSTSDPGAQTSRSIVERAGIPASISGHEPMISNSQRASAFAERLAEQLEASPASPTRSSPSGSAIIASPRLRRNTSRSSPRRIISMRSRQSICGSANGVGSSPGSAGISAVGDVPESTPAPARFPASCSIISGGTAGAAFSAQLGLHGLRSPESPPRAGAAAGRRRSEAWG